MSHFFVFLKVGEDFVTTATSVEEAHQKVLAYKGKPPEEGEVVIFEGEKNPEKQAYGPTVSFHRREFKVQGKRYVRLTLQTNYSHMFREDGTWLGSFFSSRTGNGWEEVIRSTWDPSREGVQRQFYPPTGKGVFATGGEEAVAFLMENEIQEAEWRVACTLAKPPALARLQELQAKVSGMGLGIHIKFHEYSWNVLLGEAYSRRVLPYDDKKVFGYKDELFIAELGGIISEMALLLQEPSPGVFIVDACGKTSAQAYALYWATRSLTQMRFGVVITDAPGDFTGVHAKAYQVFPGLKYSWHFNFPALLNQAEQGLEIGLKYNRNSLLCSQQQWDEVVLPALMRWAEKPTTE